MIYADKVYGKKEINDPLVLDILRTKEMERLKGVNQYGVWKYLTPWMTTTRFEHCVGVYLLLRILGAPREEQIAGLVHDIGHTAFSHVYDYVVGRTEQQDSNDKEQAGILLSSKIKNLLEKEGIDPDFILDHANFPLLENNLPDICADRIDYVLRDSLNYGITKKQEISIIMDSLNNNNKRIYFSDIENAKKVAFRFMQMDKEYWRSPKHDAIYYLFGEALKIALEKGIITKEDFFMTDDLLMEKLRKSGQPEIIRRVDMIREDIRFKIDNEDYDVFIRGKCRFIDPFVQVGSELRPLSELDVNIKQSIESFKRKHAEGRHIKILGNNGRS